MDSLVIIGSGAAGLTAALYGARANFSPLVLEGPQSGGTLMAVPRIENYPGFPEGIAGFELVDAMRRQAEQAGARFLPQTVAALHLRTPGGAWLNLGDGTKIEAHAAIIATGIASRPLGLPNEAALTGRGVSYCATCDAPLYRGRHVAIVGEGGTALREAFELARVVGQVTFLCPNDSLRAGTAMLERAAEFSNLTIRTNCRVTKLLMDVDGRFAGLHVQDASSSESSVLDAAAVFVSLGTAPATHFLPQTYVRDKDGYLIPQHLPAGIFAAGDIVNPQYRQVASAVGTACEAALSAIRYLEALSHES